MKATTLYHLALGLFIIPFLTYCLALSPMQALAQENQYLQPSEKYSKAELTQMLAPIALYPDALLSQVLMASTYPIEIIEADRWVKRNPDLKDDALDAALADKDWDPSINAICHFPSILALMSEKITETTNLGNAFLAQETEVMDMVQELRAKAYEQGNLATNREQNVIVEKETIIIEPANPRVIYVPYYDPFSIYGPWWYPAYPPYYWSPPGVSLSFGISYWPGFYFGFSYGSWSYFDWPRRYIYIDGHRRPRYVRPNRWIANPGRWHHVPVHRRGVAYRDKSTARRFGQDIYPSRNFRPETRGFSEQRDRNRDQHGDNRTIMKHDRNGEDRLRIERDKNKRLQQDNAGKEKQRTVREKQERQRIETNKQSQERVERDRQMRQQNEQASTERANQERIRIERDRQLRQPADQKSQAPGQVERQQQQRSRDNVFNRVEDGRIERKSSERGRDSRQSRGNDSRGWNRSNDDDSGGRNETFRNRH